MKRLLQNLTLLTILLSLTSHANSSKIVCYMGRETTYIENSAQFSISSIDPTLCTHIIYTFTGLKDGVIVALDARADLPYNSGQNGYGKLYKLKYQNPDLKIAIAMGGKDEGSAKYSEAISTPESRSKLANSILLYLITHQFDGFDLHWQYPGQNGGSPADKENLVLFLQELKQLLSSNGGFELSIAVSANVNKSPQSYNVAGIAANVDFINLMTYDYYNQFSLLRNNAPLANSRGEGGKMLNAKSAIDYWSQNGAPIEKLILGIPFYGRTYMSSDPTFGSETDGPGPSGPYTKQPGFLSYLELCEKFNQTGWERKFDDEQSVPYAFKGNEWISYENEKSVCLKIAYAMQKTLGGVMISRIDYDDTNNVFGRGSFPLLNAVKYFTESFGEEPKMSLKICDSTWELL